LLTRRAHRATSGRKRRRNCRRRFAAALFVARRADLLPSREGLSALLGAPVTAQTRWQLLSGLGVRESREGGTLVCACFGVRAGRIRDVIRERHLSAVEEIGSLLRAGTNCGTCLPELHSLVRESVMERA
jgi:assimilatory nitrate reductase catalytic subunit